MGAEMSIEAMKLALDCLEDIFGKDKIDVGAINARGKSKSRWLCAMTLMDMVGFTLTTAAAVIGKKKLKMPNPSLPPHHSASGLG